MISKYNERRKQVRAEHDSDQNTIQRSLSLSLLNEECTRRLSNLLSNIVLLLFMTPPPFVIT